MSAEPAKPVRCSRCRNVHDFSARPWKRDRKDANVTRATCPKCGSFTYSLMPGHPDRKESRA